MRSAIELHDSECIAIESDSRGNGAVILDAYVHRTDGEPGVSSGDGGVRRVRISMEMIKTTGEIGPLPATIYESSLALEESNHSNMVPLPFQAGGQSTLSLMLADDARPIHISGRNVIIELEGEFCFAESVDYSRRQ